MVRAEERAASVAGGEFRRATRVAQCVVPVRGDQPAVERTVRQRIVRSFFYALFPFLLRKLDVRDPWRVIVLCFLVWLAQGAGIMLFLPVARSGFLVVGLPLLHIGEFILGIGAALLFLSMRTRRGYAIAFIGIALAALITLAWKRPFSPVFYLEAPFFALLILGLAMLDRPIIGLLNARWLVKLGEASYSLYLIHVPIAYLALLTGFNRSNGWLVLAFAVSFSVVVFSFYEEPMRRAIRTRLSGRVRPSEPVEPIRAL